MNVVVVNADGEEIAFPSATRFATDEANNLCIFEGTHADQLTRLFAAGKWQEVGLTDDEV